ncbi:MAG: 6-bladed beta-propeller, partial [Rikenellaceae bacterium]|nr:6-bladed beta-propeller [Rikenellaceae bacterium]
MTIMMHFVKRACFIGLLICVTSCGGRCSQVQNQDRSASEEEEDTYMNMQYPIEVNISREYDKRTIILQDVAEVSYIPLETNKDVLLDGISMISQSVSDSLVVMNNLSGSFFVMDRDGRLISGFNHTGRGPGEYSRVGLGQYTVDFGAKEIYIVSYPLDYKIMVYSFNGDFKREIEIPKPLWIRDLANFDTNNLLVCTTTSNSREGRKELFTPYYLVSKQTGEYNPLPIEVLETTDGKIRQMVGDEYRVISISSSPIIRNGDEFFISDFASDTIYSLKSENLSPFITLKPLPEQKRQNVFAGLEFKSTRYSLLNIFGTDEETEKFTQKYIVVDHKTGELFEPEFRNNDF